MAFGAAGAFRVCGSAAERRVATAKTAISIFIFLNSFELDSPKPASLSHRVPTARRAKGRRYRHFSESVNHRPIGSAVVGVARLVALRRSFTGAERRLNDRRRGRGRSPRGNRGTLRIRRAAICQLVQPFVNRLAVPFEYQLLCIDVQQLEFADGLPRFYESLR